MAKKQNKEKYRPDQVATLMTDLKRTGIWTVVSIGVVVVFAFVVESVIG